MENNTKKLNIDLKKIFTKKNITAFAGVLLVLTAAFLPVILEKAKEDSGTEASILEASVERKDISKTLSGTGTLTAEDAYDIDIPEGVEVTRICVAEGQEVKEGDVLAVIDKTSVLTAISSVKDTLDELESEMADVSSEKTDSILLAHYSGTVSHVYATAGDSVKDVMKEYGCLATIISDDTGDELKVVGISGTVSSCYYKEGDQVYAGATMFVLEDTDYLAEYNALAATHREYEDMMSRLFTMYQDGYLKAPSDGFVSNIDTTLVKTVIKASQTSTVPPHDKFVITAERDYAEGESISVVDPNNENNTGSVDYAKAITKGSKITIQYFYTEPDGEGNVEYYGHEILGVEEGKQQPQPSSQSPGMSMGGVSTTETETVLFSQEETTVMNVTHLGEMTITVTIDELDILSASVGQSVLVTIDALPGKSFEGTVTELNTSASNSGGNSKYTATITLPYDDNMLPGMNATIKITVSTEKDVLSIPVDALSEEADGTVVYTAYDAKKEKLYNPVTVTTGASDGIDVQILSGLSEGQAIYYEYYDQLEIEGLTNMPGGFQQPFSNR